MKRCLIGLIAVLLGFVGGCQIGPRVEFVKGSDKIDAMIAGQHFTSYVFGGKSYDLVAGADEHDKGFLAKPVLYPVHTPSGVVVNRGYPLAAVQDEDKDHPHHAKVVFGDTKEGMFAIRVADWLREKGGTGRYLSSNGDETEQNVWGNTTSKRNTIRIRQNILT